MTLPTPMTCVMRTTTRLWTGEECLEAGGQPWLNGGQRGPTVPQPWSTGPNGSQRWPTGPNHGQQGPMVAKSGQPCPKCGQRDPTVPQQWPTGPNGGQWGPTMPQPWSMGPNGGQQQPTVPQRWPMGPNRAPTGPSGGQEQPTMPQWWPTGPNHAPTTVNRAQWWPTLPNEAQPHSTVANHVNHLAHPVFLFSPSNSELQRCQSQPKSRKKPVKEEQSPSEPSPIDSSSAEERGGRVR